MLALTRAGYRVYEARNGPETLKMFDQYGDAIDLLLTDLKMPYMGGAELAQHLRARQQNLEANLRFQGMRAAPRMRSSVASSRSPSPATTCSPRSGKSSTANSGDSMCYAGSWPAGTR